MRQINIQIFLFLLFSLTVHAQRDRVKIQNGTIVTDNGTLLRGAYVAIDASNAQMPTKENVSAIKNLGLNSIHLYAENPCCYLAGENASLVDSLVNWTANDSLYLILTMAGWTPERDAFVYDFWNFYAERYKNETHVVYEIENEPESSGYPYSPSITPMEINAYDIIRAHAPETHVLMLSSVYSIEMDTIFKRLNEIGKHVDWSNTSVAMHGYCQGVSEDVRDFNKQMQDSGYVITITEFESVLTQKYAGTAHIRVFEEQQISYLNFLRVTSIVEEPAYFKSRIENSEIRWTPDFGTWPQSIEEISYSNPFEFKWGALYDEGKGWHFGHYPKNDLEYIDNNDYAAYYNLNFEDAPVSFEVFCSSDNGSGNIEIHLDSINGPIVGVCPISNTGGWLTYESFTSDITTSFTGVHKIYLVFKEKAGPALFNLKLWYFLKPALLTPQSPYHGVASALPGKIEAEEYDYGGSTISFLDLDSDTIGFHFRNDDVDIEPTADIDQGYDVSYIEQGEWLEYTINSGNNYIMDIQLRIACTDPGEKIRLKLDDQILATAYLPDTDGWQNWETITLENIIIPAGENQILRLEFLDSGFNLNWLNFVAKGINGFHEAKSKKQIAFYPNPVKDQIIVKVDENGIIEIYNIYGQLMVHKELSEYNNTIPLNNLSSGSYVVKITNDSQVHSEILIVE